MAFMTRDGFRLYSEDTGGRGPAILFLHGAGGNHLSWWQQVPVFADEYRCIAVDQRGFGQSPDVTGGPGPATYFEQPETFNREVAAFLKGHRPSRSRGSASSAPGRAGALTSPRLS